VRISLIGRVTVEFDESVIDEAQLVGRQGRLLFAYLVAEHGRPVPRDELAEALWGETPPVTWEKALTVLASKLRRLLAQHGVADPSILTAAFGCYRIELPEGTRVDILEAADATDAAEKALAERDFARARERSSDAASLLQRPFLPGEEGTWVEEKRRDLVDTRERALTTLVDAHLRTGDASAAVDAAEQLVALAPLRESGYRRLMQAHAAAGNRAEALGVFARCRKLLADELGTYPSPETDAIYRELLELPAVHETGTPLTAESPSLAPPPTRSRPNHRRLIAAAAIAGLALCLAGAALALSGDGESTPPLRAIASPGCSPVRYDGSGSPELLIAADLPLQRGFLETTTPMVNAITLALERREYTAGDYRVGLQICDDAPRGNFNDERACKSNARRYVASPSVIGVVGPLSSTCALFEIPILNEAPGGPVPIVSPSATVVGLTRRGTASRHDKPDSFYPTGQRNFARVIPTDDVQAAAGALIAQSLGVERLYVVDAAHPHSVQFVDALLVAASRLGVPVAGRASWDIWNAKPATSARIAEAIATSGADGVFLAVDSVPTSIGLLRTLRDRLGRDVQLMAPEAFDPETALLAGAAAEGMTVIQSGPSPDDLRANGRDFVSTYAARFGEKPARFALMAAQATEVLLDAVASSDGTRASATRALFDTRISNGILGSFLITPTGDTTLNAVAVQRIVNGRVKPASTVLVPDALIAP
jgi:DNA-binding SARP family transcriptional activator/ABC-type branched-subunit amino acid transport system substrate-binding protein